MNTFLDPPPPASLPPPLPDNRIPPNYREKVRRYAAARRGFFARSALRRVFAIELTAIIAAIVADIYFETPDEGRWLILGALAIVGVTLLTRWWWRPALALGEAEVIRELEHRVPALGQRLRTSREAEGATSESGMRGVFASGLVADTRVRMSKMNLDELILWKTIRLSLFACIALLATFVALLAGWPEFRIGTERLFSPSAGISYTTVSLEDREVSFTDHENPTIAAVAHGRPVSEASLFTREEGGEWKSQKMDRADAHGRFSLVLTGRKESFDYYVSAGDGRSLQRHLHCMLTPGIEKVEAEVQFPDYIGLPPQKVAGGDVKAVEDSKVTVVFQMKPPLVEAAARTSDGRELPLTISGNRLILEQKLTRGEVIYQIAGTDADGLELPPSSFKLTGIEDKEPEVELVEPKKDVEATTVWEILARLRAKDDFGIAEVGIVLVVGNEIKLIAHRDIAEKTVRTVSEMGTAALEEFPLTINDNLKIYAFARDHKPRDGARSVSRLVSIDIRQFQVRWRLMPPGQGGLPMSGQQLAQFFNLIKEQRAVVSDTFVLKENGPPANTELGAECDKIRTHEDAIADNVRKLKTAVAAAGSMRADDLTLLDAAAQQMGEASGHLENRLTRPSYKQADRALSSLLAMRKEIMRLMSQSKSAMPSDSKEQSKATSETDLAAEAARLAQEEHEVREKVTKQPAADARELEVTRHQQEVAVTDAGELFAALVRHPNSSELALQRMEQAEKLMQNAEDQMKGAASQEAGPGLKSAEDVLLALAAQLRALDEKNMEETMGKLAQMAAEAKQRMEQEQKERGKGGQKGENGEKGEQKKQDGKNQGQSAGASGQSKASDAQKEKGEAKNEGEQKNGDGNDKQGQAGNKGGKEAKAGDAGAKEGGKTGAEGEKGEGKESASNDKGAGQNKGESAKGDGKENGPGGEGDKPEGQQAKGDGKEKGVGDKSGAAQGQQARGDGEEKGADGKGGKGENGREKGIGKSDGGQEKGSGKSGQAAGGEGDEKGLEKTAEQGATIDDALKGLAAREGAGKEGERLTELREQAKTGALKPDVRALGSEKDDARAAEKAGELGGRFGKLAEGLKDEQRHLLQSRIEALTELLAQTRKLEQEAAKKGDAGKEKNADGKQPGEGQEETRAQDGKDGKKGSSGANRGEQDKGPRGDSVAHRLGSAAGSGGNAPLGADNEAETNGYTKFLKNLDRIPDDGMRGLIPPLAEDVMSGGSFDYSHLQPVAERLGKMLDALVRANPGERRASGVPDEYSHLVDEYFRALSEDFRSDAQTPPDSSSPRK